MIYSPAALQQDVSEGRIIRNLSERELQNAEGVGFDLRLDQIAEIGPGSGSLRKETRRTPQSRPLEAMAELFLLQPGRTYVASTMEIFDLPRHLAAIFFPRSTLFRSGVMFQSSVLPHGYVGAMNFALTNFHNEPFEIELGSRFAHVVIMRVEGDVNPYDGQWQGGRVSQPDDEGQA